MIYNDSLNKNERLRNLVENQFISSSNFDSIFDIKYDMGRHSLKLSYSYSFKQLSNTLTKIESIEPDFFLQNDFETPFYLRKPRSVPGYIYESNLSYSLKVDYGDQFSWIENERFKSNFENFIGNLKTTYENANHLPSVSYRLNFSKVKFQKEEWNEILEYRDAAFNQLNTILYF